MRTKMLLFVVVASAGTVFTPPTATALQILHGHVPEAIARWHLQPVVRLPDQERLSLVIGLPLRNREEFNNLLQQIYDPSSSQYRRYLTPQQIAESFGPAEQDYQAVVTFAQANGLEVSGTHADRTLLRVDGTVADIEKAFHVTMLVYPHPTEARTFYAPDVEPSLDLAVPILHISGLNNYILPRPSGHIGTPLKQGVDATPAAGSGPGGAYWGNDFRAAYVPGTSLNGAGQSVGLLELDGYYTNDIRTYETNANLPNVTLTNVLVDGFSGTPDSDANWVGEVSLDIEMVVSMAPGISKVIVYESPNCCYYWVDILKRMQEDNIAKQLSSSWLFDYDDPNADTVYQEFAVQGQSFFQCSGDYLAFYSGVSQWTDDPNVTLVGGTMLTTTGPGGSWVSETTWTNGDGTIGSGGGISASYMGNFKIPSWQTNINMTANQGSTTMRNVPDVSLVAYDAWVVWNNGSKGWWWGTSIAAPLWAGFTALVNQQAATNGKPMVGFLNPALYAIGTGSLYSTCFHDITTGNNTNSHSSGLYYAVAGYDLCTGWGTPAGQKLIDALANPEALLITPATGFASIGGVGGPFTITSQSLSLTNVGTNSLTWTLVNTSLWLNASPGGGTLTPGGPAATVTVSLNSTASNLVVGTYTATVWFTNLNDNVGQSRQFSLSVMSPPSITQQPTNQMVPTGGAALFSVVATSSLPLSYFWQRNSVFIAGGTNSTYTTNNVQLSDSGSQFSCLVSNAYGSVLSSNALLIVVLVQNGGFETGDFTGWTLSGSDTNDIFVDDGSQTGIEPHSGNYLAALGPVGSLSFLSQTLSTTPGTSYILTFWLDSPDGETPNEFLVSWNGNTLLDETNLPAIGWTNFQFVVTATTASTVLQFGSRDDPSYLGLDDIGVVMVQPAVLPGIAGISLSGPNLVINGSNGLSGATYYVLMSTNVVLSLNQWTPVATNVLNASGNFIITATNAVNLNVPLRFYILQMQ